MNVGDIVLFDWKHWHGHIFCICHPELNLLEKDVGQVCLIIGSSQLAANLRVLMNGHIMLFSSKCRQLSSIGDNHASG